MVPKNKGIPYLTSDDVVEKRRAVKIGFFRATHYTIRLNPQVSLKAALKARKPTSFPAVQLFWHVLCGRTYFLINRETLGRMVLKSLIMEEDASARP
jgi:hypothetical protein